MAAANPALGTGIGTFDVAHAPYAEVAFTQHAHNSYLQLAGESGLPAIALFLLAVGVALMSTFRSARATGSEDAGGGTGLQGGNGAALLAAGAGAGILGGLARNLFDSDLYVPANAFVLAAMCGLGLAAAATSSDTPVGRGNLHRVFAVLVLLLFLQFVPRYALARFWARNGEAALLQRDGRGMEAGYKFAAMTDSLNQEYMLKLAGIYVAAGNASEAESAFREAIRRAKTGKAYYQYARFLSQHERFEDAINAHQKARELDPHNLQNLLALAETYATEARVEDAERVYRRVAELYDSPVGQVRAVPELIEYEFGEAYRALGEIAMKGGDTDGAESNLRQAVSILGEYWARRKNPMVQIQVRPEKALLVGDKYRQALSSLGNVLKARGRAREAAEIDSRSSTLLAEIERDKEEAAESDR